MWSCGLVKSFAPLQFAQHHASMTFWNSNWTLFGTPAGLPTYPKHVKATTWFLASAGRMLIVCSHCYQFIDLGKPWITWLMVNLEMSCWYGESCVCVPSFFWLVCVAHSLECEVTQVAQPPEFCLSVQPAKQMQKLSGDKRKDRKVDPKLWPLPRTFNGSEFLLERQGFPFQRLS